MSEPKQISRGEMAKLLKERCPTMSEATVNAALSGAVLKLSENEVFQAPVVNDGRATHHVVARARKVGTQWIS